MKFIFKEITDQWTLNAYHAIYGYVSYKETPYDENTVLAENELKFFMNEDGVLSIRPTYATFSVSFYPEQIEHLQLFIEKYKGE